MWPLNLNSITRVGEMNTLEVLRETDDGFILDGGNKGEILLPASRAPEGCKPSDKLEVFIYPENDGVLSATCNRPLAQVGECAFLKVVNVTRAGAFMDWGIQKDLLVPVSQQLSPMEKDRSYVVYIAMDPQQRIIGSSKLHRFLDERARNMQPGQAVDIMIVSESELGYKAVIDGTHLGLLFKNEVFQPLKAGEKTRAFIKAIRDDRKIDLGLRPMGQRGRDLLTERILSVLEANNGVSRLTDYSPPEAIYKQYAVSKNAYKKALGALYKQRLISVNKDEIRLLPPASGNDV